MSHGNKPETRTQLLVAHTSRRRLARGLPGLRQVPHVPGGDTDVPSADDTPLNGQQDSNRNTSEVSIENSLLNFQDFLHILMNKPSQQNPEAFATLDSLCSQLVNALHDYSVSQEVTLRLQALKQTPIANLNVKICLERLLCIAVSHEKRLREAKLAAFSQQVRERRKPLLTSTSKKLNLDSKRLEDISSQVQSQRESTERFSASSIDRGNSPLSRDFRSSIDSSGPPDLQKQFYSLCISIKLNNFGASKSKAVPIAQLWTKAKKVPQEQWPEFIANELAQPIRQAPLQNRLKRHVLEICP